MIKLYSTEKRDKVELVPLRDGHISMYVCGPTVYDSCHIGHARPAIVFDTIRRYLEHAGYAVTFISNVTDIDDKIIARAKELGISCRELASRYQDEYETDMAALGVRSPTIRPKATEHISEMIDLIKGLEDKGVAYTTDRGVWFDVKKFADYGRLSGRTVDDDDTEHRVETDSDKRNIQDFALWKFSKPGEPEWDSPWGKGRPGWHIECSAMSGKYFDWQFDIHGGGADLAFPHHENELAQSEAYSGKKFVNYWLHNGFITVAKDNDEETKMGKSKGNAFWLRSAFAEASPAAIRLWILGTHYRSPLLYKPELIKTAEAGLDRIYTCIENIERAIADGADATVNAASELASSHTSTFNAAMSDDFNTPQALAAVYGLIGDINSYLEKNTDGAHTLLQSLISMLGVLGLPSARPATAGKGLDKIMQMVIGMRNDARESKNYELSDKIRDGLADAGVTVNDRDGQTTWTID